MSKRAKRALAAVNERLEALARLENELQEAEFRYGQEQLLRWADETSAVLARDVSKAEAERFDDLRVMHTYTSLPEYFEEFTAQLAGLGRALFEAPGTILRRRTPKDEGRFREMPDNQLQKIREWFLQHRLVAVVVFGFIVLSAIVAFLVNVTKLRESLNPPKEQPLYETHGNESPIIPDNKGTIIINGNSPADASGGNKEKR